MENIANICLVSGNLAQRQEVIKNVKSFLGEFDYVVFDNTVSIEFIEREMNNYDCFGGTKLFIMNGFPLSKGTKATALKKIKKILENLPPNHYVILNDLDTENKSFLSFINKVGKVYSFDVSIDKQTAVQCISEYFNKIGKEISTEAINLFVNALSGIGEKEIDLDTIFINTYKIESFIGKRKKITREDILNVCDDSDEFIIWNLFDCLDKRKLKDCLLILERMNRKSNNTESNIIPVIKMLHWKYKLLIYLKECKALNYDKETMINSISNMKKLTRKGSGYKMTCGLDLYKNGNPKLYYSEKAACIAYEGNYYNKPTIDMYSRQDLYLIMSSVCSFLLKMREMSSPELNITLRNIILKICER